MNTINGLTAQPYQQFSFDTGNGTIASCSMRYSLQQYIWFFSMIYGSLQLNGIALVNSANLLRQWKNVIPFGLAVLSQANRDPSQLEDFSSEFTTLNILSATEIQGYETYLSTGVLPP
jgi:hypothetical protein